MKAGRIRQNVGRALAFGLVSAAVGLYGLVQWPLRFDRRPVTSGWITDRTGRPLYERLGLDAARSGWIPIERMPEALIDAVLAAEDRRFHWHLGIDPVSLLRACGQNLIAGRIVSGGSTITQQLARLIWPRPRTLGGKLAEALRALRLEASLTKSEILEQYLNRAPFGNQLFGVGAAARVYLDKSVETLTPAESALLASLPRAPGWLNPYRRPREVLKRQRRVLRHMADLGYLSAEALASALGQTPSLKDTRGLLRAPHFVRQALTRAAGSTPEQALVTTLDLRLQTAVEGIVRQTLAGLQSREVGSAAVLVLDTRTREVLSWVGSPDFDDEAREGQNDGVLALRQPGSTLKPFTYLVALEGRFTASSLLADLPTHFETGAGPYTPSNYDSAFHGPVRLRVALASSLNVPAVQVAERVGLQAVLAALRRFGFESLDRDAGYYGLALTLGAGEVRLLELANAYATLAELGVWKPVRLLRGERPGVTRRATDPASAALVLDMLADDKARALTFGEDSVLALPFPVAAKTGTSKNFRDNWCVGATPELTVAVWAGNFSGRPMGQVSGVTGAGPIWRQVLQAAMEGRSRTPLAERAGLVSAAVCPLSGDRPGVDCPTSIQELFAPGKLPEWSCQMHVSVRITADGMSRANPDCPAPGESIQTFEVYPPRFEEWAQRSGRPLAPRGQAGCAGRVGAERRPSDESAAQRTRETSQAEQRLRIQSPVPGGQYAYDPGIPQAFQKLRMRVASPKGRKLQWRLNGLPLAEGVTSLDWPVRRGRWTLEVQTADDGTPLSAAAEFLVK